MNIKNIITFKTSVNIVLVLLLFVTLFHILVLLGVIPYTMVWGGQLESKKEM